MQKHNRPERYAKGQVNDHQDAQKLKDSKCTWPVFSALYGSKSRSDDARLRSCEEIVQAYVVELVGADLNAIEAMLMSTE